MVAGLVDGYLTAVRRIGRLIDVMQALGATGMGGIELNDNLIGQTGYGGSDTHTGGHPYLTVISNVKGLHDGNIKLAVESVTHLLCHMAQVDVIICNLTVVYSGTEILVGGIRSAVTQSVLTCQYSVT